ncbi:NUDIX domain-containing protein [Streptomyces sp. 4F14]|uniref:NUDIX domain-containing protein n=1 Tax=Streptomyces sp. 4F14 TaxID=3394380 RepID=UPI003A848D7F
MHKDVSFTEPPRRRVGALGMIRNEEGEVLLVRKNYGDYKWNLPGGSAEGDEAPYEALQREIHEETGLNVRSTNLLLTDYVRRNDETGSAEGINFVWDCGTVPNGIQIVLPQPQEGEEPELTDFKFVKVSKLEAYTTQLTARRIHAAFAVLNDSRRFPAYLENGWSTPEPR